MLNYFYGAATLVCLTMLGDIIDENTSINIWSYGLEELKYGMRDLWRLVT